MLLSRTRSGRSGPSSARTRTPSFLSLALPLAMLVGGAIAIKPASQLFAAGLALISAVPMDLFAAPAAMIPQLPLILLGGTLLAIGMLTFRMLEE